MAEAVVGGTPMSRFFCHKCSVEVEGLLPDYTCPRCSSGFIEELECEANNHGNSGMDISQEDPPEVEDFPNYSSSSEVDVIEMIMLGLGVPTNGQATTTTTTTTNRPNESNYRRQLNARPLVPPDIRRIASNNRTRIEAPPFSVEYLMNEFMRNFVEERMNAPGQQDEQPSVFDIRLFLGNPGDYVWGRDGWDAIVTQLLNQMDGTGPPPLPRKEIDEIPTAPVTQNQVDTKLQCSVCWEDFKLSEPVRQLPCQHCYHAQCIVPWLELHDSCPICRQSVRNPESNQPYQDIVAPTLAALFGAGNESNNSRTTSNSSSSSQSRNN